jgi:glycerophosphoryl diester phosphodiesterase
MPANNIHPRIVAHRGFAARYPENTLDAVRAAYALGVRMVEIDVQIAADGVPVLLHDADLQRTAGRPERIFDLDAATATRICVGEPARLGARFPEARLPTLAACVALVAEAPERRLCVEIKAESIAHHGLERTVDRVADAIGPHLGQCTLISYDEAAIAYARESTRAEIGWVLTRYDDYSCRIANRLAPEYLFCNHQKLPPGDEALWHGPWAWICYEVTDPALAQALFLRGVHLVETMAVDALLPALAHA